MNSELVFYTTYTCPRCHFALESDSEGPPTWLRCPRCGRASMPPEIVHRSPLAGVSDQGQSLPRDLADPADAGPIRPRPMAARPAETPSKTPTLRLILGIAFFLALLIFVFSLLNGERVQAGVFGVASAGLLFVLARPGRHAPMD